MSQKWKKSTIFLTPLPQDVLDFFEFGKNWKFDDPPSDLIWEKLEIGNILNFGNPPSEKNISFKHLKLPKNPLKTNLFFLTESFKVYIYIWGKNENIASSYQKVQI